MLNFFQDTVHALPRLVLIFVILLPTMATAQRGAAAAADTQQASFEWALSSRQVEAAKEALGVEVGERRMRGIGVAIVVISGAVAIPYLANALVSVYRNATDGGTRVCWDGSKYVIERDKAIDGGTIVIKDGNGVRVFDGGPIDSPADLIPALAEAMKK